MRTVKDIKDMVKNMKDTDPIWFHWFDKDDIHEWIQEVVYDEIYELLEKRHGEIGNETRDEKHDKILNSFVTNDLVKEVMKSIGSDYIYQELYNHFQTSVNEIFDEKVKEWCEKEYEQPNEEELWDIQEEGK